MSSASPPPPSPRPLIWVVDDSLTQAAYAERALGDRYRYERFSEGASVIERLAETNVVFPDLVLLDWVMPGMSGYDVCRHLRSQPTTRELPIIILTASRTETDDIVSALEGGANDYLTKPFVPEELHARVENILRAVELQRTAEIEHQRVVAINALAAAILEAETVERVLEVMARWLVDSVVDGCTVSLTHETGIRQHSVSRSDESKTALAAIDAAGNDARSVERGLVKVVPIRGIAMARVVLARDAANRDFDDRDVLMITTCLEYSTIALEAALRSERERKTTRFHEEMVGIVGHDLRGPLSAFSVGLGVLRVDERDKKRLDTLSRLERSSARMGRIVEQLVDVTRARIGNGIPVMPQRVGLRALIDGVLDEIRIARPTSNFRLVGDEVEGNWDPGRLEQVVANLAGNAAQYGREGAPITIDVSVSKGAAHLEVHSQNRGAPIPLETRETMFDPFERGRTSGSVDGLGLGLYIVQQIVRAHHGSISVTSTELGTTFRVTLPTNLDASPDPPRS